jgi:ribosomal protein L21E
MLCLMPDPERVSFKVGDRVKMSALGSDRSPQLSGKVGTVIGVRRNSSSVFIRFDGNKTPTTIHRDYVDRIDPSCGS